MKRGSAVTRNNADQSVQEELLTKMRQGEFSHSERLPRESILAERLGISRTQLRDSLALLEQEGYISRRQGVGTLINRHILDIPTRMDMEREFMDMVRDSGFKPGISFAQANICPCDERTACRLQIDKDMSVLRMSRLVTADGISAIYCEDFIDVRIIKDWSFDMQTLSMPVFSFLDKYCETGTVIDVTEIHTIVADERLAGMFSVQLGTPLLYMDEVDYDIMGNPVFCSDEYFLDGIIKHTVLRKKI
jgi:GntR family transcriptional regulator